MGIYKGYIIHIKGHGGLEILYIKGSRDVEVTKSDVTLGDLLSMECADKMTLAKLRTMKILKFPKGRRGRRIPSPKPPLKWTARP